MINMVRYLLEWPRDSNGEVIFLNTHEAIFYAIMVKNAKALVEEIELLRYKCKKDLYLEKKKASPDLDLLIQLGVKHQFYSECIDTAKKLFEE